MKTGFKSRNQFGFTIIELMVRSDLPPLTLLLR